MGYLLLRQNLSSNRVLETFPGVLLWPITMPLSGPAKGKVIPKGREREREIFCDDSLRMANGVTTGVRYFWEAVTPWFLN